MNTELLIVIAIIILSSLYTTDVVKPYNAQVVFVLGCLIIVLLYKFIIYAKFNKLLSFIKTHPEAFQSDFSDSITDFLNRSDVAEQASPAALQEYNTQLTTLRDKVDIMNGYLSDLKTQLNAKVTGGAQLSDQYNIQASQQIQDYQIKKLTDDIQRANDLIKEAQLVEDAAKYKKIPLINSCVIQHADGSVGVDTTLAASRQTNMGNGVGVGVGGAGISNYRDGGRGGNAQAQLATQSNTAQSATTIPSNGNSGQSVRDLLQTIVQNGVNISVKQ